MDNKIEKLSAVLKKLNQNKYHEELNNEAKELINSFNSEELSLAEQKLIDDGINNVEELRGLCAVHIDMFKDHLEEIKISLSKDHVLSRFFKEHNEILKFLEKLDKLNSNIQKFKSISENRNILIDLESTAKNILSAEKHHKREEDVLFPKLEALGITGPTRIMRLEHDELRIRKKALLELITNINIISFDDFKDRLNELSNYIVFNMRDHIFKENYILYPTAYREIKDNQLWKKMKQECDEIGYCPFTPKE